MAPSHEPTPLFRVVVATNAGMFHPAEDLEEGDSISAGQVIGHIVTRQGAVEVPAHAAGLLTEWLAHYDDPVAPGQPVARIGGHQ
jgi:[acyl-carrier-protein] S-malonyltransferase